MNGDMKSPDKESCRLQSTCGRGVGEDGEGADVLRSISSSPGEERSLWIRQKQVNGMQACFFVCLFFLKPITTHQQRVRPQCALNQRNPGWSSLT